MFAGVVHPEIYWIDGADFLQEGQWNWMHKNGNYVNVTGYTRVVSTFAFKSVPNSYVLV